MADVLIIDLETGKTEQRAFTTAEKAEQDQLAAVAVQQQQVEQQQNTNRSTIVQAATQALATNRIYVGLASPTAAQTTAEVKALARQQNGIIRLLLGLLDASD